MFFSCGVNPLSRVAWTLPRAVTWGPLQDHAAAQDYYCKLAQVSVLAGALCGGLWYTGSRSSGWSPYQAELYAESMGDILAQKLVGTGGGSLSVRSDRVSGVPLASHPWFFTRPAWIEP